MASKKFEKNSPEWKMFMELWALCQKYWIPEDIHNEEYWHDMVQASDKFVKDNPSELASAFAYAFITDRDRIARLQNESIKG